MIPFLAKLFRRRGAPDLRLKLDTKPSGTTYTSGMSIPPGATVDIPVPAALSQKILELQRAGAVITTEVEAPVEVAPKQFRQNHYVKADGVLIATFKMGYRTK